MFEVFVSHGLFAWILIGLIAGWLTGKVTRGRGFGCIANVLLGLVGAVIGGWIFSHLGINESGGFIGGLAAAVVGAVVLVSIARMFAGSE